MSVYLLDIEQNAEGSKLACLRKEGSGCGFRIAGPKAWGSSRNLAKLKITEDDLVTFIEQYAPEIKERLTSDKALEARVKDNQWISVETSLPDDGEVVVFLHSGCSSKYIDEDNEFAINWHKEHKERFGYLYQTAISGKKWMVSSHLAGVGYIANLEEVTFWKPITPPDITI